MIYKNRANIQVIASHISTMLVISFLGIFISVLFISPIIMPQKVIAQTQPEVFTYSPFLPVGSGARAIGMGDAFIGVADDATAASWNPAGLAQLKRYEISFVGNCHIRRDSSSFNSYPGASVRKTTTSWHINYFSIVYPHMIFKRNLILSINYQQLYDMTIQYCRKWHYTLMSEGLPTIWKLEIDWDYKKQGTLGTLSPAIAFQVIPPLALGITLNLWPRDMATWENGWTKGFNYKLKGIIHNNNQKVDFERITHKQYHYTFSGTNLHLGFLWRINHCFTLGGVYKTPFSSRLNYESRELSIETDDYLLETHNERQTLMMPPSYGLGLAARISDNLTLAFDTYRTDWQRHILKTRAGDISAVTDNYVKYSHVKPTYHLRLGGEYLFIAKRRVYALRSGLFYDPDPSREKRDDFYGFSLGTGIAFKNIALDLAYKFRFARDAKTISFQGEWDHDDITQHFLYLSVIQYF